MDKQAVLLAIALVAISHGAFADAPTSATFALSNDGLTVTLPGAVKVVQLGCIGRGMARVEDRFFVACGKDGVVIVDVSDPASAHVVERRKVEGEAINVFVLDNHAWVRTVRDEAHPVDTLASSVGLVPPTPPPPPPAPSVTVEKQPRDEEDVVKVGAVPRHEARSIMLPPRRGNVFELGASALGFVNIGPVAGGALFAAGATYRFGIPLFVGANIEPAGGGTGNASDGSSVGVGAFTAYAIIGLDSQWIEAGIGAGSATLVDAASNFMLVTRGRIGARDGLHFRWTMGIVVDSNRFDLGTLAFGMQIPFTEKWDLEIDGKGGTTRDFAQGLVGVRYQILGDGGRNTVGITGSAGFAGVQSQPSCSAYPCSVGATYIGPAISAGVDWRF